MSKDVVAKWTDLRLRRLFRRFNKRYWSGKLPTFSCVIGSCDAMGQCDSNTRTITIDITQHPHDREVRATLLHEMAQVASHNSGHGVKFFAQLEKLLRQGARISIANPEAGQVKSLANVVPRRFPLLRRKMEKAETRRTNQVLAAAQAANTPTVEIADDYIISEFADAALEVTWEGALAAIGIEYGLIDETRRPLNRWAAGIIKRGRSTYLKSRRAHLQEQKLQQGFKAQLNAQRAS
jgi:hypothetical protein